MDGELGTLTCLLRNTQNRFCKMRKNASCGSFSEKKNTFPARNAESLPIGSFSQKVTHFSLPGTLTWYNINNTVKG